MLLVVALHVPLSSGSWQSYRGTLRSHVAQESM